MRVRVGVLGLRPGLAVHAVAAVAAAGAQVVPLAGPEGDGPAALAPMALTPAEAVDLDLVLLDGGLPQAVQLAPPLAVPRLVVHLPGEHAQASRIASALAGRAVVELPSAAAWLAQQVAPAAPVPGALVVVGAVGGAGASTLAIAAAAAAGADCLLVDADPRSTGLDLPLGMTELPGARWPAIPASDAPLVAESLRAALPRAGGVALLAGPPACASDPRVAAVVAVGRRHFPAVVVDAGRDVPSWVTPADEVVVVAPATLAGLIGVRRLLEAAPRAPLVAVRPSAWLGADAVAAELGVHRVLDIPSMRRVAEAAECGDVLAGRVGRELRRLGARTWTAAR
ncbi:MAG: hypothetical protein MUF35_05505 [Candidatus Nanopelagicales bacterium]|jgi:hypothetical protein|nr:hypothetical protein [Candidatus Nanopelagicales bacterium]